jgi:hypothetical protein
MAESTKGRRKKANNTKSLKDKAKKANSDGKRGRKEVVPTLR